MEKFSREKVIITVISVFFILILGFQMYVHRQNLQQLSSSIIEYREQTLSPQPVPTTPVIPEGLYDQDRAHPEDIVVKELPESTGETKVIYTDENDALPWGVAQPVDDITYTIRVGYDDAMASPSDIVEALNQYRSVHGIAGLVWDDKLGNYAQSRADYFQNNGNTDKHAGLDSFLDNEDGFRQLGFNKIGENSFFGGPLTGTHLIEWVFSQSPGHDANQLDPTWTHVGIGVTHDAVNINFGSGQI